MTEVAEQSHSPSPAEMEERWHLIYENANSLRTHQDSLRWTISASYVAFLGAALALSKDSTFFAEVRPHLPSALFVVGNVFLLILAVESWYYNVYSSYVNHCEQRFASKQNPDTLPQFRERIGAATTPFHFSFIFVLALVTLTNVFFLHLWLREIEGFLHWVIIGSYSAALIIACRFWSKFTYRLVLLSIKWLFTGSRQDA